MSAAPVFGWTVTVSMPSVARAGAQADAETFLDLLLEARIERAERGPTFSDERAAVDWLARRSAEHATTGLGVPGAIVPRVPVVLVFTGSLPDLTPTVRIDQLVAHLASPACLGFAWVEPPALRGAWAARRAAVVAVFLGLGVVGLHAASDRNEPGAASSVLSKVSRRPLPASESAPSEVSPLKPSASNEPKGAERPAAGEATASPPKVLTSPASAAAASASAAAGKPLVPVPKGTGTAPATTNPSSDAGLPLQTSDAASPSALSIPNLPNLPNPSVPTHP